MQSPPGVYRGFKAVGGLMRNVAKVDASVGGAVATAEEGYLA